MARRANERIGNGPAIQVCNPADRGVGRDPENGRRQVAHPIQVRVVGPRPLNRRAHGGDRFEVDAGAGAFESARPLEHEKAHEGYGRDDHGDN